MADEAIASETIIGPGLGARHPEAQEAEALMACNILNRMIALGRLPIHAPTPIRAVDVAPARQAIPGFHCAVIGGQRDTIYED